MISIGTSKITRQLKHYWAGAIYAEEDALGRVLCRVCSTIEGKGVTLASELDYSLETFL